MFIFLFCVYPFLVTRIFHMFSCRMLSYSDDATPEQWHRYDYSINCWEIEYMYYKALAYAMSVRSIVAPTRWLN